MKNRICILLCLTLLSEVSYAQPFVNSTISRQKDLAALSAADLEGYNQKISGQDIDYHSALPDCSKALLVRATDGQMSIEWSTAPVPEITASRDSVSFFFLSGMSLKGYDLQNADPGFQVFINGVNCFAFNNKLGENWTVNGLRGSRMSFYGFTKDQASDVFGYVRIVLPSGMIKPDETVTLKITGNQANSQHWFMVFQYPDSRTRFVRKAQLDHWFELSLAKGSSGYELSFILPATEAGKIVNISNNSGWSVPLEMKRIENNAVATLKLKLNYQDLKSRSYTIADADRIYYSNRPFFLEDEYSDISEDAVEFVKSGFSPDGSWTVQGRFEASEVKDDLLRISSSTISHGVFQIIASSHQDIAWMDSPAECRKDRDELLITPAIKQLQDNPAYANDMEDVLMLREYLERHPESKKEIHDLGLAGRLSWGASFIQPYEEMYFGEPLIRQFYLGRKWFRKEFPGCDSKIYWNVDVPGRTLQMPQILAKSGVDYMIISRQDKGLFNWAAPDGSKVLTYSSDHYYNSYIKLKEGFFKTVTHLADLSDFWGQYYSPDVKKPVVPVLSDADMALPDMYFDYIDSWNALKNSQDVEGRNLKLPDLEHTTALQFMQDAINTGADFPTITGERPNVWLYIHGPSHYEALRAGRSAGLTLPAAEKFSSLRCMAEGNWDSYPQERLTRAWESGIYPDHGWGGKHGDITDSTFQAKFSEADVAGRTITREAVEGIAKLVKLNDNGIPVLVFNSLSWNRTDPVTLTASWPDKEVRNFTLMDSDGNTVAFQLLSPPQCYESGFLKKVDIMFIARDIPSMGYSAFYISRTRGRFTDHPATAITGGTLSTPFYHIVFSDGGMSSLVDKELNREVWLVDQFTAGELFTMQSIGNGAGEFADVQQPDMYGFERLKGQTSGWKVIENGLLRTVIETESVMKHNRCKITWTIYKTIKRIDVRADLIDWDGTAYREFRLAFPAKLDHPELSYEVPFGVVRVGKDELQQAAGERYVTPCKDVHPRGINNWFSASDKNLGITISSSVAVWDYVNMTDLPTSATILQPILLASRQSCHGEGPLYHQKGSHSMEFSIFTHKPGWENGYHHALQANEPLVVVVNPIRANVVLPQRYSFIGLDDSNTLISTIKKEEFGEGLIIRLYDSKGEDKMVQIRHRFDIPNVFRTNLIEEEPVSIKAENGLIELSVGHHSIETLLLRK